LETMAAQLASIHDEAERRLEALQNANRNRDEIREEAKKRGEQLTALTAEAQRRLEALEEANRSREAIRAEAEKRAELMSAMTARLESLAVEAAGRLKDLEAANARNASMEATAADRLRGWEEASREAEALRLTGEERLRLLEAVNEEAAKRLSVIEQQQSELAKLHSANDANEAALNEALDRISGLEAAAEDDEKRHESIVRALETKIRNLGVELASIHEKHESARLQVVALETESLYNSLIRRIQRSRGRASIT